MQYLLQPRRPEKIPQTTEAVERWDGVVGELEQSFDKMLDENVRIGVVLALEQFQEQNHCHLNSHTLKSYEQVRTNAVRLLFSTDRSRCWWCIFGRFNYVSCKHYGEPPITGMS